MLDEQEQLEIVRVFIRFGKKKKSKGLKRNKGNTEKALVIFIVKHDVDLIYRQQITTNGSSNCKDFLAKSWIFLK